VALLYSNAEQAHLALGDTFQARQFRERARELAADPWSGGRADLYGGDLSRAARAIQDQDPGSPNLRMMRYDNLADIHARMGDVERRDLYAESLRALADSVAPRSE
jgi:hypothetical protein